MGLINVQSTEGMRILQTQLKSLSQARITCRPYGKDRRGAPSLKATRVPTSEKCRPIYPSIYIYIVIYIYICLSVCLSGWLSVSVRVHLPNTRSMSMCTQVHVAYIHLYVHTCMSVGIRVCM